MTSSDINNSIKAKNDDVNPSVISMSKDYPKHRDKVIIGGVVLFLLALILGVYLLTNYFSSPLRRWEYFKGGTHLVFEIESKGDIAIDKETTLKIAEIMGNRIREFGLRKTIIDAHTPGIVIIQVPEFKQVERLKTLLTATAMLEFKLVDEQRISDDSMRSNIKPGYEILYMQTRDSNGNFQKNIPYLVKKKALLTGSYIKDAKVQIGRYNTPFLAITFNDEGAKILDQITSQNIGKKLAIVLDNSIYTAPVIQERITGGSVQLTGQFSLEECRDLEIILNAGSGGYPAKVRIIEEKELTQNMWLGNSD